MKYTCWVVADVTGVNLFMQEKPVKINDRYTSSNRIGKVKASLFPKKYYIEPVECFLTIPDKGAKNT